MVGLQMASAGILRLRSGGEVPQQIVGRFGATCRPQHRAWILRCRNLTDDDLSSGCRFCRLTGFARRERLVLLWGHRRPSTDLPVAIGSGIYPGL